MQPTNCSVRYVVNAVRNVVNAVRNVVNVNTFDIEFIDAIVYTNVYQIKYPTVVTAIFSRTKSTRK